MFTTVGPASKPVTRTEHERRVSSRLTRGIAAEVELPKRLGATASGGTGMNRYRDMATASGVIGVNSLGESRGLASKDDISMQRSIRQPKK